MTDKLTIRDIARECSVSIATVSRVLNNKAGVAPETARRIQDYISENRYDPYGNIPLLNKARGKTIRVVVPYRTGGVTGNPFFAKGLSGIEKVAYRNGYDMVLTTDISVHALAADPGQGRGVLRNDAGIIMLCPFRNHDELVGELMQFHLPVALINRRSRYENVITVTENRRQGIRDAVDHLMGLGYRDIAGIAQDDPALLTFRHLETAFRERGLDCGERRLFPYKKRGGFSIRALVESFRAAGDMPRAMFICAESKALCAIKSLQRLRVRVPEDVAVIGYDNAMPSRVSSPGLTTVNCPVDRMGALAAALVMEQTEEGACRGMNLEVESRLIIRESCGYRTPRATDGITATADTP